MSISMTTGASRQLGNGARGLMAAGVCLLFILGANGNVLASGNADSGLEKSKTCVACHGETGISMSPVWPTLAGQYESYIIQALKSYRSGTRENAIMAGFASALSDQDIEDLAAYFSAQEGPLQTAPIN